MVPRLQNRNLKKHTKTYNQAHHFKILHQNTSQTHFLNSPGANNVFIVNLLSVFQFITGVINAEKSFLTLS